MNGKHIIPFCLSVMTFKSIILTQSHQLENIPENTEFNTACYSENMSSIRLTIIRINDKLEDIITPGQATTCFLFEREKAGGNV